MNIGEIEYNAIAKMRSPYQMHIICVDVTNKCDLHCSNCTRLLKNQSQFWDMTPENFRRALLSLQDYPGVIAMIGGNPCMHPKFEELCNIFADVIPNRRQRGLWSNNVFNHQDVVARTFGTYNLNPHGDSRGIASLMKLKELIPNIAWHEGHSHHAPLLTAIKDIEPDKSKMWEKIANCDINRDWSAAIIQNKGEIKAYFCEVAASFDLARGEDNGHDVVPGWWKCSVSSFQDQVLKFCPGCGVPARLKATLDSLNTDQYTVANQDLALNSLNKRRQIVLQTEFVESGLKVTDYPDANQNKCLDVSVKAAGCEADLSTPNVMRVLLVMPHYYRAVTDNARHGSSNASKRDLRLKSFEESLGSLWVNWISTPIYVVINEKRFEFGGRRVSIDLAIVSNREFNLLDSQSVLPRADYNVVYPSCDPKHLGFECHKIMADNKDNYDLFGYIEDDIVIDDPYFFEKIVWLNGLLENKSSGVNEKVLLHPVRYELLDSGRFGVGGAIYEHRLYKKPDNVPRLGFDNYGRQLFFEMTDHAISGCFFVNKRQLNKLIGKENFGRLDSVWMTELDTAVGYAVMKNFQLFRPAAENLDFLRVRHAFPLMGGGVSASTVSPPRFAY